MYALVKDNMVVARESRRTNMFNIPLAGYKSDEELKEIGIVPVLCDQYCNMATHEMVNPVYTIGGDDVSVTYTIQPRKGQTIYTAREFRNRFTQAEKIDLYTKANDDVMLKIFIDELNATTVVDVEFPETIQGMQYLIVKGVISQDRCNELMATLLMDQPAKVDPDMPV